MCIGRSFSLLVFLSVCRIAELKTVAAHAVLPIGLCRGSRISLLVSVMRGQNHCVPLDFCHRSCIALAARIKLRRYQTFSFSLFFSISSSGSRSVFTCRGFWRTFTNQLCSGVSSGVRSQLQPCVVMASGLPPDHPRPLECCTVHRLGSLLCLTCLLLTTSRRRSCSKKEPEKSPDTVVRCVSSIAPVL